MKHIVLLFFLTIQVLFADAQSVNFENSLNQAFGKARIIHKTVFIEYYNSDCSVCMKLEPFFGNVKLAEFYNTHFVSYKMNIRHLKKEDSLFIVKSRLKLESVPYFLFFDNNEKFLHYSDTQPEVDFLIEIGNKALNPDERAAGLEKKYKKGDRSIKTLYAYSLLVQLYKNESLTSTLAADLYESFPKTDLGNKKSYIITKRCVNSIENGFFKYWIKNIDKFEGMGSEKHNGSGKQILADIVRKSIYSKERKHWNLNKIAEVKKYILLTGLSKNPDAFF